MLKKQNGITLVALVITIIVLLILAGVTISSLAGQNSLIERTIEARDKYKNDEQSTNQLFGDAINYIDTYRPSENKTNDTTTKPTDETTNPTDEQTDPTNP